jgi:hypothetical protein
LYARTNAGKKVHASKPDTPRLKSMIFSYKMRYFPAFYVVVKWPS